ncbi:MAG: DUF5685 family protein [Lachnospiraceae bacterium]|nr:DUF5685 family protein [Lachnospiraceae bacterium]
MFGYVIVNKAEMKYKEFDVYHSYYCGLCHVLKENYGRAGQLSLSYDMTFVLMLLTSLYEPEETADYYRCLAHPFEKHLTVTSEVTEYVADMNVLLTYLKAQDDWKDEKKITGLAMETLLGRDERKVSEKYRKKADAIMKLMRQIAREEKEGQTDIDTMAGLFGSVMAEIVAMKEDEWQEILRRLGYYLGKFIYLADAYEDIETDIKKNNYNPLRERYQNPEFEDDFHTILTMMIAECCKAFEQLPIIEHVDILRNILYSGVWCRYLVVREKREKEKNHE